MFETLTETQISEMQEKRRQTVSSRQNAEALVEEIRPALTLEQVPKVLYRMKQAPRSYRLQYQTAMAGHSRRAAITSFCQMCMGWDSVVEEVSRCTDLACPLYPYRPYQGKSGEDGPSDDSLPADFADPTP